MCRCLGYHWGQITLPSVQPNWTTCSVFTAQLLHANIPGLHRFMSRLQLVQLVRASLCPFMICWFLLNWFSYHHVSNSFSWHSGEFWNAASSGAPWQWLPVSAGAGSDRFSPVVGAWQAKKVHFHTFTVWRGFNNSRAKGTNHEEEYFSPTKVSFKINI